ncbi:hypothetical protein BJV77DRAFT_223386 [Russula vinacea]|nr:hypothetical protein BJV77DRAFT_223386 [Russula vinacea]
MKFSKGHLLAELHATYWGKKDTEDHQQLSDCELSEDDDIINGCHVLNINNQAIKMGNNIWVRAEYIRIYDFLLDFYNQKAGPMGDSFMSKQSPAAVITGQPGIGKTTWLNYALYRCLLEKRPVIWRYMDSSVLFVDEGVYHFTELAKSASFRKVVWTLVDSPHSVRVSQTGYLVLICHISSYLLHLLPRDDGQAFVRFID